MTSQFLPLKKLRSHLTLWVVSLLSLFFFPCYADDITDSLYQYTQKKTSPLRADTFISLKRLQKQTSSWVLINAIAKGNPHKLLQDLKKLGLRSHSSFGRLISGQLPSSSLSQLESLSSLNELQGNWISYSQGSATTQGDIAQHSNYARKNYQLTGRGVTVALLSDSFNCLGSAKKDFKSNDLPTDLFIKEEALDCNGTMDEGRALTQIVHDIAPSAKLIFQSGSNGLANTANAILDLAFTHNADIIIDDMKSLSANMYQEDAISQAISKVNKAGVTYITAAGNSGRNAYESKYNEYINNVFGLNAHDFDTGPNIDIYQRLNLPEGERFSLTLQWDSPAYSISGGSGAQTDLDIFIFNQEHNKVLASSTFGNIGRDPVETLDFINPVGSGQHQFDLMITKAAGVAPQSFKYIILNSEDGIIQEYQTHTGGIFGHANSESAITVGASNYLETPAFGVIPPLLQYYSSAGSQTIKLDINGNLIEPRTPQKPDIVAPDNVNTTFFGTEDHDKDGYPNISGTSAAAPHVAGVVALLLEANPSLQPIDIKNILQQTAVDILQRNNTDKTSIGSGYDLDSGFGLINAEAAIALAKNYTPSPENNISNNEEIVVNDIDQAGGGSISPKFILFLLCIIYFQRIKYTKLMKSFD